MDDARFAPLEKVIQPGANLAEISRAIRLVSLGGGNVIEFTLTTDQALKIARKLEQPDAVPGAVPDAIHVVEPPAPAPLTFDLWAAFFTGGALVEALRPALALLWAWWAR